MSKGYWKRPITLRLTAYQRKVLSEIVDGALDAGACKDGLTKLESNALSSIFQRLIGVNETVASEDTTTEPQGALTRENIAFEFYRFSYPNRWDWPRDQVRNEFNNCRGSLTWDMCNRSADAVLALSRPQEK